MLSLSGFCVLDFSLNCSSKVCFCFYAVLLALLEEMFFISSMDMEDKKCYDSNSSLGADQFIRSGLTLINSQPVSSSWGAAEACLDVTC